jgi:hypothetical protein
MHQRVGTSPENLGNRPRSTGFAFNSPSGQRDPENTRPGSDTAAAPCALLPTRAEKTCSSVGHAERIVSNPHRIVPKDYPKLRQREARRERILRSPQIRSPMIPARLLRERILRSLQIRSPMIPARLYMRRKRGLCWKRM